jgi:hypothetical protein
MDTVSSARDTVADKASSAADMPSRSRRRRPTPRRRSVTRPSPKPPM